MFSMELIFVFLLASYGVTNILTGSRLFAPIRDFLNLSAYYWPKKLGELLSCPMCTGFWCGVFWYAVITDDSWRSMFDFEWIAFGAMASGFCWVVFVIMQKLGESEL